MTNYQKPIKVKIKLNNGSIIIVYMDTTDYKKFRINKQIFTWLTLNNYTDDLDELIEINVDNISSIHYEEL